MKKGTATSGSGSGSGSASATGSAAAGNGIAPKRPAGAKRGPAAPSPPPGASAPSGSSVTMLGPGRRISTKPANQTGFAGSKTTPAHHEQHDFSIPETQTVVPADQLKLTETQMEEDVTRVLTANDPNAPNNMITFYFKESEYKKMPPGSSDNIAFHFCWDGSALHVTSEDAKAQLQQERAVREAQEERAKKLKQQAQANGEEFGDELLQAAKVGKNQFNYSDRACQTFINSIKCRAIATEPPPTKVFGATVTQWDIYDSYIVEWERQQHEAAIAAAAAKKEDEPAPVAPIIAKPTDGVMLTTETGTRLKILERMVNQNSEDEVYNDFKYWEDASDAFRPGEGSLLPLWRFADPRARRKQVTALAWNPKYPDMFVVTYGHYDFMKQGSGMIAMYSLKNTSHPESTFTTDTGVMCVDIHPQHAALLAVGCYDGSVRVYDVRRKENKHLFMSDVKSGKHTDPVWQIHWQEEDLAKDLNFFSVSSDGRVANWIMSKNELKMEPVMTLKLTNPAGGLPEEEASLTGLAGGCCFDFNRFSEHLFVVGTEEGKIHKCSKAYSGQYLTTYEGHHMAVYAVKWNPFHPRVFLSCSADWTVKLWDHKMSTPIMSFDLKNAVGDVAWSTYSSTVFAAVTSDGKVHVYDLSENKREPLCEQKVVKRAHLTHVVFNNQDPMILVGDDRGGVNSLKLSPNLRKITPIPPPPPTAKGEPPAPPLTRQQVEIMKMEKLLEASDNRPPPDDMPMMKPQTAPAAAAAAAPAPPPPTEEED